MSKKPLDPNEAKEASAEITLGSLTDEVLRDIARNESCSRAWRKAATKLLMEKNHPYKWIPEVASLMVEILDEQEAEREVQAVVESATEEPLNQSGK